MNAFGRYWVISFIMALGVFNFYYKSQEEFYWLILSILNQKTAVFFFGNFAIANLLLIFKILYQFFFGRILEGERLVKLYLKQGNNRQDKIQIVNLDNQFNIFYEHSKLQILCLHRFLPLSMEFNMVNPVF